MFISTTIYAAITLVSLLSIVSLIFSIKNKNKQCLKILIWTSIIFMIYLIIFVVILPKILRIEYGFEIWLFSSFAFIAEVIYLITIILNFTKKKKLQQSYNSKKIAIIAIILILAPVLLITVSILRDTYLINNSDLILVYYSDGNNVIGAGQTIAYAINSNFCKQFEIGTDYKGYSLKNFLPKNASKLTSSNGIKDYDITVTQNYISVYKNGKCIFEKNHNYININFERGFYINNN